MLRLHTRQALPNPLLSSPFLRPQLCFYSTTKTSQIGNKRTLQVDIVEETKKKKKGYKPRKKIFKYFMINKPFNVLSQFSPQKPITNTTPKSTAKTTTKTDKEDEDNTPKKTLQHYFKLKNIYPVGRLDTDSEGLLLLTDNVKGITQRLLHPNQRHERTYLAQLEGIPTAEALKQLQEGVKLREFTTLPAKVELLKEDPGFPERNPPIRHRKNSPTSWIKLILTEGKNRQVRRMTAAVGFPTLRLIRTNIAGMELGDLEPGKFRELTREEATNLENTTRDMKIVKIKRKSKGERGPFEEMETSAEDEEKGSKITRKEAYTAARLLGAKGAPMRVDIVGVDIGKAHTGICGFDCTNLVEGERGEKWPRVTAIALINAGGGRGQAAHFACDVLDELFARDEGLQWVKESKIAFVEQQLPLNPQAKQVAQGIRSGLRCLRMAGDTQADPECVTFVSGQSKYTVAPVVCPTRAKADPLRAPGVVLRGHTNKPKRKLLGERDAYSILDATKQHAAKNMIAGMCEGVDQIHDVTDALLIGMAGELKRNQGGGNGGAKTRRCNLKKDQRNSKRERISTEEQKVALEIQRNRTREAHEERKKKETWWVDLQKHYMTAKDYQQEMFDRARQGEELEEMEQVKEIEDKLKGRKNKNKFDEDEENEDEENEEIDLSVEPKQPKRESKSSKETKSKSKDAKPTKKRR